MTLPAKNNETDEKGIASGVIVEIKGRVKSFKKETSDITGDFIVTLIVRPAKDAFSHPTTYAVKSIGRIGKEDSDVSVFCELRPYSRKKNGSEYYNVSLWVVE